MHGRKIPFTEKNGDIWRSYTNTAHGHRIRCETVKNEFRIWRLCKNTEWLKTELLCSVYGAIWLPYTVLYHHVRPYVVVYGNSMYHFSDSQWKLVNILTVSVFSLFCFPFCILDYFHVIIRRRTSIFKIISFIFFISDHFDPTVPRTVSSF
jgi:hypothetical protein